MLPKDNMWGGPGAPCRDVSSIGSILPLASMLALPLTIKVFPSTSNPAKMYATSGVPFRAFAYKSGLVRFCASAMSGRSGVRTGLSAQRTLFRPLKLFSRHSIQAVIDCFLC